MHCTWKGILIGKFRRWEGGEAPLSKSILAMSLHVFQRGCQRIWNGTLVLWILQEAHTMISLTSSLFQTMTLKNEQHNKTLRGHGVCGWCYIDVITKGLTHATASSHMRKVKHDLERKKEREFRKFHRYECEERATKRSQNDLWRGESECPCSISLICFLLYGGCVGHTKLPLPLTQ